MADHNKVNILGIDVTGLKEDEAVSQSIKLVGESKLGIIYFLTAESSLLCQNNAEAAAFMDQCDLVLPGDLHMEKAFHLLLDEETDVTEGEYAGNYMKELFARMNEEEYSIYAIMDSEEALLSLQEYILTNYPSINLDGILADKDSEGEAGRIVNDINACIPDIVFFCVSAERQIRFVRHFSSMMNTGLCVCIESMQPWIHKETTEIPSVLRALHLDKLYLWFKKDRKIDAIITGSIFRNKVLTDSTDGQAGRN